MMNTLQCSVPLEIETLGLSEVYLICESRASSEQSESQIPIEHRQFHPSVAAEGERGSCHC